MQLQGFERESIDPQTPREVGVQWTSHRQTFHPASTYRHGKGGKSNLDRRGIQRLLTRINRVVKNSKYCTVMVKL